MDMALGLKCQNSSTKYSTGAIRAPRKWCLWRYGDGSIETTIPNVLFALLTESQKS